MRYVKKTPIIKQIDFCFLHFKLVNKLCQVMHDDIEDDDGQQQSSLTKPTTSPNGYSLTSSNSNTTDG
jgi:hypothetical protein